MTKHDYLICYDIANPKRLAKVAKLLEHGAIRVQYSIFWCQVSKEQIAKIVADIEEEIEKEEDDVRIYCIKSPGITLGCGIDLSDPFMIV